MLTNAELKQQLTEACAWWEEQGYQFAQGGMGSSTTGCALGVWAAKGLGPESAESRIEWIRGRITAAQWNGVTNGFDGNEQFSESDYLMYRFGRELRRRYILREVD